MVTENDKLNSNVETYCHSIVLNFAILITGIELVPFCRNECLQKEFCAYNPRVM